MKRSFFAILLLTPSMMWADESAASAKALQPVAANSIKAPRAWMGMGVAKPDPTVTSQLPALPPGVGFLVNSLDEGGPASKAGLKEFDLVWKWGEQLLVNEAQLATLLRLAKPGEVIRLSAFRSGQPLELTLTLGEAQLLKKPIPQDMVESAILSADYTSPTRIVNVAEKTAIYTTDGGRAEVRRDGEIYHVSILGPDEKPIFQGELQKADQLDQVPENWRRRVSALCRGLDQSLDGRVAPSRQPRPRVVPPMPIKP